MTSPGVRLLFVAAMCGLLMMGRVAFVDADETDAPAAVADFSELEEQAIRAAVARASASILRIEAIGGKEDLKNEFSGATATTGIVVDTEGHIVTSSFAVQNDPSAIIVIAPDGKRLGAKIVARDEPRHLVLLKIEPGDLTLVPAAATAVADVKVGQTAIALGRTLDKNDLHMSVGLISSLGRIWNRAVQTDAKVSPRNYGGALVDLRGRTIGILAPLSPHSEDESAGVEWYDAGLGFAVPLADVMQRLETWKQGTNLKAGRLGVGLKRGNAFVLPAKIASCRPGTPSHAAGIRAGDTITAIDGLAIARQTEMRHVLGGKYAGDKVSVTLGRGEESRTVEVELAGELTPWQQPSLGILPARGPVAEDAAPGLEIRHVFEESPAKKAGLIRGDRITRLGDKEIKTAEDVDAILANLALPAKLPVVWSRVGESREGEIELAGVDGKIDDTIAETPAPKEEAPAGTPSGLVSLKRDELPNSCQAWIPDTYRTGTPHGLLVWLSAGDIKDTELESLWNEHCRERRMIVMVVRPTEGRNWQRNEIAAVHALISQAQQRLTIDRRRIAVLAEGPAGQMAWALAFMHRDLIRGVAALDFPLNPRAAIEAEPLERLEVLARKAEGNPLLPLLEVAVDRLRKASIPVELLKGGKMGEALSPSDRERIAWWFDALDRL